MQAHQFAARPEKTYPIPVKSNGQRDKKSKVYPIDCHPISHR